MLSNVVATGAPAPAASVEAAGWVPAPGHKPTIVIAVPWAVNARDVLRTGTFRTLKAAGARLVILSSAYNDPEFVREFADENVYIEPLHAYVPGPTEEKLANLRCTLFSDLTRTTSILSDKAPPRSRWKRAALSGAQAAAKLIGRRTTEDLLAFVHRTMFPGDQYLSVLQKYRPDLVVLTRVFGWAGDEPVLKCAAKLGIPTVLLVASWDNLTKGVFPLRPDRLVVWSSVMFDEAQELHGFRPEQIFIGGVPQFDLYADRGKLPDRATFFQRIGADASKGLITFAMADPKLAPDEADVVEMLWKASRDGGLKRPCQILVRIHPQFAVRCGQVLDRFQKMAGLLVDIPGRAAMGFMDRDPGVDDMKHLAATILHSDVVVNTRSTIAIDAAALDRPAVCAGFDGHRTLPYADSVRRFLDYSHYRKMLDIGGVRVAGNFDELFKHINDYLDDPARDREARARLVERECRAIDGKTGQRVGEYLLRMSRELRRKH
jgi:CDP-Glycerol:Poly(glycerophosphate) glycerophosphotransferase